MNTSELEALANDLRPWGAKPLGSIRIDVREVSKIVAGLDEVSTLRQRIEALEAENERLRRNIKGWVEWHRRCDADDDCTYLNDNAWCGADALASTGMGLLAHAAMQQKERDDG